MRKSAFTSVLALGLIMAAAVISAQAADWFTVSTAKVPFAFTIGTMSFPAGNYTIQNYSSGMISFGSDRDHHCLQMTYAGSVPKGGESAKLVFRRYDDQYFLSELYNGSDFAIRKLPVSKHEKELIRSMANRTADSRRQDIIVLTAAVTR